MQILLRLKSIVNVPRLCAVFSLIFIFFIFSCSKHSTDTNPSANNIPDTVHTFLPDNLLDTLQRLGMTINGGIQPPNVDGFYYASSPVLAGTNIAGDYSLGTSFTPVSYAFSGQTSDFQVQISYASGTFVGSGTGAFISGNGNAFSIYVPVQGKSVQSADTVNYTSVDIYSGTLTSEGIRNFKYGFIITWKSADPAKHVLNVGQARVLVEHDSLTQKVATYPYTGSSLAKESLDFPNCFNILSMGQRR